jgi:hypothetical protein
VLSRWWLRYSRVRSGRFGLITSDHAIGQPAAPRHPTLELGSGPGGDPTDSDSNPELPGVTWLGWEVRSWPKSVPFAPSNGWCGDW